MKYEEIEVGNTYVLGINEKLVKYKEDSTKEVVTSHSEIGLMVNTEDEYKHWTEKSDLPETGLLVHENSNLIYRTGKDQGYGFNPEYTISKSWSWTFESEPKKWRKATVEEEKKFIELLKKEAERRGLTENAKIKECLINGRVYSSSFEPVFTNYRAWNTNGCIFRDGEWAEPGTNDLSEQIEQLKEKAKDLGLKLNITVE